MKIKELYDSYTQWHAELTQLTKNLPTFKSESCSEWNEPFYTWAEDYINLPDKKIDSYSDLVTRYFIERIIEKIDPGLTEWRKEAVASQWVDETFQLTRLAAQDEASEESIKTTEWFIKIATSLTYKAKRDAWNSPKCLSMLYYILLSEQLSTLKKNENTFLKSLSSIAASIVNGKIPHAIATKQIETLIAKEETKHYTYFGSYPSDNSDSEEEEKLQTNPNKLKFLNVNADHLIKRIETYLPVTVKKTLYAIEVSAKPLPPRWIANITNLNQDQFSDLEKLNENLRSGMPIKQAMQNINTRFFIAKYRGIAYNIKKWGKPARTIHRATNEINQALFSTSAFFASGHRSLNHYYKMPLADRDNIQQTLQEKALTIRNGLLKARNTAPVIDNSENYIFKSQAHQIQSLYTKDYEAFHKQLENKAFGETLLNEGNPFLSTGNVPLHALRYAYATKYYESAKDHRLRPRWRQNGLAERPYSGKVYASLHPLSDLDMDGPFDVIQLQKNGELSPAVINNILHERETTFSGFIEADRIKIQHIAKYPSFKNDYKDIYLYKYGLHKALYDQFKQALLKNKPHSAMHKHYKNLLSEWLCCYHEVRLIEETRKKAESLGGIILYYNSSGCFGLEPDEPNLIGCSAGVENTPSRENLEKIKRFRRDLAHLLNHHKIATHHKETVYQAVQQKITSKEWPDISLKFLNDLYQTYPDQDISETFARRLNFNN